MSLQELGIEHKWVAETLAATVRVVLEKRADLPVILAGLRRRIPPEAIAGPPVCIIQFVTSVTDGLDVEVGFPVHRAVEAGEIRTRLLPAVEVLSLMHQGPAEELRTVYRTLHGSTAAHGLISDEFAREVYPDWENPAGGAIEVQFIVHNWNELLVRNLDRVLGEQIRREVVAGMDALTIESTADERFPWVKAVMERLDRLADEYQKYDAVSGCAHVFPQGQIDKLKAVYEEARSQTDDPLHAVDAVIAFMADDPGWGERPRRQGRVIYATKGPRDPQGHASATSEMERRKAYCFCPLVRNHLDQGMPITFCYCGAGWYRQQWEGAIGRPVRIEVVQSVLKGDDECLFAIHLPDDLQ